MESGFRFEVFSQLFHERTGTEPVPALTAGLDWTQVSWSEAALSGEELRQVHIDRHFERAVDEAMDATLRGQPTQPPCWVDQSPACRLGGVCGGAQYLRSVATQWNTITTECASPQEGSK